MTRRSGRTVLKTPCCSTMYCGESYASINFSAAEHWSDDRHVESLAPQGEGLCRCLCGAFFLIRQCEEIGHLPLCKEIAPEGWETMEVDLPDFMRNQLPENATDADRQEAKLKWLRYIYDTRPAAERALDPPDLDELSDADCGSVIATNPPDRAVMVAARRAHWRHLNDPFRDVYRAHREFDSHSLPEYTPTDEQRANMEALVALLDGAEGADYNEVAELYRELGEFDLAGSAVMKAAPNRWGETIALILRPLIAKRIASPVRYRWQ